jgi:hypothetical protein
LTAARVLSAPEPVPVPPPPAPAAATFVISQTARVMGDPDDGGQ